MMSSFRNMWPINKILKGLIFLMRKSEESTLFINKDEIEYIDRKTIASPDLEKQ